MVHEWPTENWLSSTCKKENTSPWVTIFTSEEGKPQSSSRWALQASFSLVTPGDELYVVCSASGTAMPPLTWACWDPNCSYGTLVEMSVALGILSCEYHVLPKPIPLDYFLSHGSLPDLATISVLQISENWTPQMKPCHSPLTAFVPSGVQFLVRFLPIWEQKGIWITTLQACVTLLWDYQMRHSVQLARFIRSDFSFLWATVFLSAPF